MKRKILVIVGPTAVGKTKISVELAKLLNGEIINGDALQVYQGLDIITDKISENEMCGIPHHLFSFLPINENYSVADYQSNIREKIKEIELKNKTPILVGGTGLYIKAALYDYDFSHPNNQMHLDFATKYQNYSNQELYQHLKEIDAESADVLHYNNRRRVLRAIEIYETSGKKKSAYIKEQKHKLLYDCCFVGLTLPIDQLNKNIEQRVDQMFEKGVVEEVKNHPTHSTAANAIGYHSIEKYLCNQISLEECKNDIKIKTRQYRKRQMTWLKHQFEVKWFDVCMNTVQEIYNYFKGECQ